MLSDLNLQNNDNEKILVSNNNNDVSQKENDGNIWNQHSILATKYNNA